MNISDEEDKYYLCNFDESPVIDNNSLKKLWSGEWSEFIKHDVCRYIVEKGLRAEIIGESLSSSKYTKWEILNLGISCLLTFCDKNWNPALQETDLETVLGFQWPTLVDANSKLQQDSEDLDVNIKLPQLLLLATELFTSMSKNEPSLLHIWWLFRCKVIHQRCLEDISHTLYTQMETIIAKLSNFYNTLSHHPRLQVLLSTEIAQAFVLFGRVQKAEDYLNRAKTVAGLKLELQGVLGKRTKFQQHNLPQLALASELDIQVERTSAAISHGTTTLPKQIDLKDDVRLDKIQYADQLAQCELPSLEQTLCILSVQYLQRSQPKDDLADEELFPFIEAVLSQKQGAWPTRVATLLIKCKLESNNKRTIERSMMQCEAVVNGDSDTDNTPVQRLSYLWASGLPPCWKWQQQLADLYLSLGLVKAALDVYLKLQLWEDVIVCYTLLQLRHKAAEVIQQQIDLKPTPKLYCLLGDATDDIKCYEKAWELSEYKSSRAQRHWGNFLFNHKKYSECIPHYEKSLEINSLQERVWLRLGYAALEIENWQISATAYRRYTYLNPNSFEAWNNLAKVYVKQGDKERAHKALLEALKFNYDNWKLWENVIAVSTDTGHFDDVIRGVHRILDVQGKYTDAEVLTLLVNAVVKGIEDADGNSAARLQKRTAELLGRLTSVHLSNPVFWRLYADVSAGNLKKAQMLLKAYKGLTQSAEWSKSPDSCKEVVLLANSLLEFSIEAFKEENQCEKLQVDQQISSARLTGQGVIRAVEKEDWPDMDESLNVLRNSYNNLMSLLQR